jgi:hypothetical protein
MLPLQENNPMDEQEILEQRYRFFVEKGISIAMEHDRVLVTLFTAIIAGLLALVVYEKVGFWSGTFFLIADVMAVMGLAFCLLHMAFTSKVMHAFAAFFGGEECVPNVLEGIERTEDAVRRLRAYAQGAYSSQLGYLFLSVFAGGIGLAIELWPHVKAIGLVFGILVVILVIVGMSIRLRAQLRRMRPQRQQAERKNEK